MFKQGCEIGFNFRGLWFIKFNKIEKECDDLFELLTIFGFLNNFNDIFLDI